jgi:RNA polymerase sigma factor (TIGR02999 family)
MPEAEDRSASAPPADQLMAELYRDLRSLARRERRKAGAPGTLQTTALIHEAYLKLRRGGAWEDRRHFLAAAAATMRQVLVDAARTRLAQKRGSGVAPLELDEELDLPASAGGDELIVNLGEALQRLGSFSPRLGQVVECRFFAGYTEEETADALQITARTVRRDWIKARTWLFRELQPG